jgi:hypothetical protein
LATGKCIENKFEYPIKTSERSPKSPNARFPRLPWPH